ncbi:MAG: hypothetical protein BWY63_02633 [Chloroflexi bacterium ADurb.Bin360]|nr:MAG: hypothetical protein BWY63_02633 [Chloroflexi bacterium ADurb.Bin360]
MFAVSAHCTILGTRAAACGIISETRQVKFCETGIEVTMRIQRTTVRLLIIATIILTPLLALRASTAVHAQAERPVLAFYYAWFDANTWALPLPDQPRSPYVSADPIAIENHVLLAQQAGIDALVLDWYGPQVENNQTETNFRILLEKAAIHGLKASLTVDIAGPFINTLDDLTNALLVVRDQHAPHAAFLRIEGKPVVFFWRQDLFSVDTWKLLRQQIDPEHTMLWIAEGIHPEALQVFDGLYLYSVAWSNDPAAVLTRWGNEVRQWAQTLTSRRYWVATVMPGYNDLATGRTDAFVQDRAEGDYYRATWAGAIQSNADWVVITSFNEWLEGTAIEPSQNYGDTFINLTRELGQQYRQMQPLPPPPTATPDEPTATPETTPEPTATPEPLPTATPEPTATMALTPTATLPPTATPIRLPTPTPRPPGAPTAAPQLIVTTGNNEAVPGASLETPSAGLSQRYTVEGAAAPKRMSPTIFAMFILAAGLIAVPLYRWWRTQKPPK